MNEIEQTRTLRAKRPAIGRMVGVTLDMDDVSLLAFRAIAFLIKGDAACDRAIRTGVAGLGRIGELEGPDHLSVSELSVAKSKRSQGGAGDTGADPSQERATGEFDIHRRIPPDDRPRTEASQGA